MAMHDTTTLTFVRTQAGVVKVAAGQRVPEDVLPGELHRLLRAGAVRASKAVASIPEPGDNRPRPRRTRKSDED